METPQELYARAFNGITSRFTVVTALRRVAELGMPAAAPHVYKEWLGFTHQLFHDPHFDKMFVNKQEALEAAGGVEAMGMNMAQNQLSMFKAAVDAASLVFAHSIVDSALLDFLRVTVAHNHMDWFDFIQQKKIQLSSLKNDSFDEIAKGKVLEYLESLDRESLLVKVDRLFAVCRPRPDFNPMDDYTFDRGRLEKLDKLRREIVHGSGAVTQLEHGDEDIWFLEKTCFYFFALVNMRYDTRLDPNQLVQPKLG